MEEQIFLKGAKVYLRLLQKEDANGNYAKWLNDPEVCKYNSHYRFPMSQESIVQFIENSHSSRDTLTLAICEMKSKEHIGNISLQQINYIDRTAEVAFVTGEKQYWGKGYTKEAARLLLYHAFNALNLNRVHCGTHEDNIPMQKLAEKLGFAEEGRRRQSCYKNGNYYDIIEYGLLKDELNE